MAKTTTKTTTKTKKKKPELDGLIARGLIVPQEQPDGDFHFVAPFDHPDVVALFGPADGPDARVVQVPWEVIESAYAAAKIAHGELFSAKERALDKLTLAQVRFCIFSDDDDCEALGDARDHAEVEFLDAIVAVYDADEILEPLAAELDRRDKAKAKPKPVVKAKPALKLLSNGR